MDNAVLQKFMEFFDADKNGTLEFNEIFNLILYLNRLSTYYADADRDGDASLDGGELQSLLRQLHITLTADETSVLLELLPRELIENLNFENFVQVLFFAKDKLAKIKDIARKNREANKKPKFKIQGAATNSDATKEAIRAKVASNQPELIDLVNQCKATGKKWEDPDFVAAPSSLFPNNPERRTGILSWARPEEISSDYALFVDGVDEGDVIQGDIGDCYLLSAFCVIATRGKEIEEVFTAAYPKEGIYQCRFFKDGEWRLVTIDDRIPVVYGNTPAFGRCRDKNEMWTSLMEKAYAKLHGSYGAIESGEVAEALTDLTGEPGEILVEMNDSDKFWKKILRYHEAGYVMGCAKESKGDDEVTEMETPEGLLMNHAYGILHVEEVNGTRLVRVRNPWGSGIEWNGAYSDGAKEWTQELIDYFDVEFGDDGTFFMEFLDWAEQFNRCVVVHTMGAKWDRYTFEGDFGEEHGHGGCLNHETWAENYQFRLTVPAKCSVFISCVWTDARLRNHGYSTYDSIGCTVIKRLRDNKKFKQKSITDKSEIKAVSNFIKTRGGAVSFKAKPNQAYTLVFSSYLPNCDGHFYGGIFTKGLAEITPLRAALPSSVIKGEWIGPSAAGCPNHLTWHWGPQYLLTIDQDIEADITVLQPRVSNEVGQSGFKHIGFHLFPANPQQRKVHDPTTKLGDLPYKDASTVTHRVKMKAGIYNILPATFLPNQPSNYGLVVQGAGCQLTALSSDWQEKKIFGEWKGPHLAGGCHNNGNVDYTRNPRIKFMLSREGPVNFCLQIAEDSETRGIGFYIFKLAAGVLGDRLFCSNFTTEKEVSKSTALPAGEYAVVPVTYKKGIEDGFTLIAWTDEQIILDNLDA
eukprot:TRINITY_DN3534_c0_g1_i2.p1 TRINITY_DN3534_c0_g1~~TRINITY_DN3534_c0_g1_i2.p1  ORF type:complete len:1010 (-),score=203.23 TRINITY_DN3534_c0_g1_i2:69-2660(-)